MARRYRFICVIRRAWPGATVFLPDPRYRFSV